MSELLVAHNCLLGPTYYVYNEYKIDMGDAFIVNECCWSDQHRVGWMNVDGWKEHQVSFELNGLARWIVK